MIEARGDDGDGRVRFAPELPVGLVEELSGSAAVRSVMDAGVVQSGRCWRA
jgi:hypothetical protein